MSYRHQLYHHHHHTKPLSPSFAPSSALRFARTSLAATLLELIVQFSRHDRPTLAATMAASSSAAAVPEIERPKSSCNHWYPRRILAPCTGYDQMMKIAEERFVITQCSIETSRRWIGLRIDSMHMLECYRHLFDVNIHITLCKLSKDDARDLRPFFALMRDRLRVLFLRVAAGENLFMGKCKILHSLKHEYCCADLYIKEPLVNTLRVLEHELQKHIPSRTRPNFHLSFESTDAVLELLQH